MTTDNSKLYRMLIHSIGKDVELTGKDVDILKLFAKSSNSNVIQGIGMIFRRVSVFHENGKIKLEMEVERLEEYFDYSESELLIDAVKEYEEVEEALRQEIKRLKRELADAETDLHVMRGEY